MAPAGTRGGLPAEQHDADGFAAAGRPAGGSSGIVLIAVVVSLFIISGLVVGMLAQTATTDIAQVYSGASAQAYYLAESGYRYFSARLRKGADMETELHGQTFPLDAATGSFTLHVYPRYFIATGPVTAGNLATKVAGGLPPEPGKLGLPASGWIRVGSGTYDYSGVSYAAGPDGVTFQGLSGIPFAAVGTEVYLVGRPSAAQSGIGAGGTLVLANGDGFPEANGVIEVDGEIYVYRRRNAVQLSGIYSPFSDTMSSFDVTGNTDVVLRKMVELRVTGTSANAAREVRYFLPLAVARPPEIVELGDTFEDKANWGKTEDGASSVGAHAVQDIGGNNALRVTGTGGVAGAPLAAVIPLKWAGTNIDFNTFFTYGGNILSYDAQVKVGFLGTPSPDWGFDPSPVPKYFAGGISFRLNSEESTADSYGLSYLRGSNLVGSPFDNLDNGMVPDDDKLSVVLWKLTGGGATFQWLAYKDLTTKTYFTDAMESGVNEWSAGGLWHQTTYRKYSGTTSWYYGREDTRTYNTGARTTGNLVSQDINLCYALAPTLSFRYWYQTEPYDPFNPGFVNSFDVKYVDISTDGGATWTALYQLRYPREPMNAWGLVSGIDLSAYADQTVRIRFRFDSIDNFFNNYEGWYIDNVSISGSFHHPLEDGAAPLVLRLKEGGVLNFIGGGPAALYQGDIVYGQTSGATGVLSEDPIPASGEWAADTAAGTLLLKNPNGTFQNGEFVRAVGKTTILRVPAAGTHFWGKANLIRAYYGAAGGCGAAGTDVLDDERAANPRRTAGDPIVWPAENAGDTTAAVDRYTLVQWDALCDNPPRGAACAAPPVLVDSLAEPGAILVDDSLTSPAAGTVDWPEVGLHAFGKGTLNTYFDDFGLQTLGYESPTTPPAVQGQ